MEKTQVRYEEYENDNHINLAINSLIFLIYLLSFIYGIVLLANKIEVSKSKTIVLQSFCGLFIPFIPLFFQKVFKIKLSNLILIIINIFAFCGIILGETFSFYYLISFWDRILHLISGIWIPLVIFSFLQGYFINTNFKHKTLFSLIFSFTCSLAIALLWEVYEFTMDQIFHTNMQKFIPENNNIFNGGVSNLPLNGTENELAEFFKTPNGYKYALLDTMYDMIMCLIGSSIFFITTIIIKNYNKEYLNHEIIFLNKLKTNIN